MQDYLRCDAVEQLRHAWREAAFGAPDHAKRHIEEILQLLNSVMQQRSESTASVQRLGDYIESARAAAKHSDMLGVVLALIAAEQELAHQ